jgi:tetratricopeptide (TPR) repeat protein
MNKYSLLTTLIIWCTICFGQSEKVKKTIDSVLQIHEFDKIAEKLILSDTADIGLIFARVAGLSDNKRGMEAIALLDRLLFLRPNDYRLLTLKSMAVYSLNAKEKITYYHELIKRNPFDPLNYFNLGETYATIENYKKALAQYNKAIELSPSDEYYKFERAKCKFNLGRKEDSCKDLEALSLFEAKMFRDKHCK